MCVYDIFFCSLGDNIHLNTFFQKLFNPANTYAHAYWRIPICIHIHMHIHTHS